MPTHYQGTEEEVRALNAYINLMRAGDSVYGKVLRSLGRQGFSVSQFGVMETLHHLGPMCQKDLARKVLKTSGNLTMVVANLARRGFVKRTRGGKDQRFVTLEITPKGRKLIGEAFPAHVSGVARLMRHLEPQEQETLRELCRKLGKGIQAAA